MKRAIIGIVETRDHGEGVIRELHKLGFASDQISALLPDKGSRGDVIHETSTKAPEGAVIGGATLGAVGGALGLLAGIGLLAIPGLGPFIAAGPILAALSGAAAGAALGGVGGALLGMGVPEIEAKVYEGKLRGGNVLIAIHCETSEEQTTARDALKRAGAHDVSSVLEEKTPRVAEQSTR